MPSFVERWQSEQGDARNVSLVRLLWGVLLILNAWRGIEEFFTKPYFGDFFHIPILPEALVPSRAVFGALLAVQACLALLVTSGRWARPALLASGLVALYFLLCDRVGYHNNRYALGLFACLLALTPCDRAFVLGKPALGASERVGPLWAQRLIMLQLGLIYLASSSSKLFDPDWRGGAEMADRIVRAIPLATSRGVPLALLETMSQPWAASFLAKAAISTELFLAVGLFLPRTRAFALWWGTMFHITIELTHNVELFGWLTLTLYALFATPALGERVIAYDPDLPAAQRWVRLIRLSDWLARFQLKPDKSLAGARGLTVFDRNGSSATGFGAFATMARALPLLFPLSVPLALLARAFRPKALTNVASS